MIRRILAAAALLFAFSAHALDAPQVATLKAACAAVPACQTLANEAQDVELAAWFNTVDATYIVWKTSVSRAELMQDAEFNWTRVDNLSVGKERVWVWMFQDGPINPSYANVRAGIAAAWVGTAADLAVQAAVLAKCKRPATRAEKALAVGSGTTNSPSVMTFVGSITYAEASLIRS